MADSFSTVGFLLCVVVLLLALVALSDGSDVVGTGWATGLLIAATAAVVIYPLRDAQAIRTLRTAKIAARDEDPAASSSGT
jgi:hypothetical protein